jgi:hypothetical protein
MWRSQVGRLMPTLKPSDAARAAKCEMIGSAVFMLYTRLDLCCANAMKSSRFLERNSRNAKIFGTSTSLEHKNGTSCLPPGAHFGQEVDILGEYAIRVHAS